VGDFVMTAGRLWDRAKGADTLDRVAAHLPLPVVMAGSTEGPHGERISLSHARSVGHLDHSALAARLAQRPIFASLSRYEPFGLAVLEAAQAGCPLVLSAIPTFQELWHDAAIFVDMGNEAGAAAAIQMVAASPDYADKMGAMAQARANAYSVEIWTNKMLRLFAELFRPYQFQRAAKVGSVA
jgi:glycosyltransferase involved in cell wall biosynthesis